LTDPQLSQEIPESVLIRFTQNAIEWATGNIGNRDYTYKCLAFVEDAYETSNSIEMFGGSSAAESAEMYGVSAIEPPPRGAFVFYSSAGPIDGIHKSWGHVGIAIGKSKVIHAWDDVRTDKYLSVELLQPAPGWTTPRYIGWVPPSVFLCGYRIRESGS